MLVLIADDVRAVTERFHYPCLVDCCEPSALKVSFPAFGILENESVSDESFYFKCRSVSTVSTFCLYKVNDAESA